MEHAAGKRSEAADTRAAVERVRRTLSTGTKCHCGAQATHIENATTTEARAFCARHRGRRAHRAVTPAAAVWAWAEQRTTTSGGTR